MSLNLTLATTTQGNWDFEAVATLYRMDRDETRLPATASATGTSFGPAGRVAVLGGSTIARQATALSGTIKTQIVNVKAFLGE